MDLPLGEQCIQFVWALGVGSIMAIGYAICRHAGRRRHEFFWDLLFTILSVSLGCAYFLTICRGWPRIYHLFGIAAGAGILRVSLRRVSRHHRSTNEKN